MRYEIQGNNFPVVVCTLDQNESMINQSGAMSWMSPNMAMSTTSNGGIGKVIGRMFTNESLFQNIYTAQGGVGTIAFASSLPGEILPVQLSYGHEVICQKSSFLASERGVELSVYLQKKLGAGLFGGEGFIMQKLSGQGTAFVEIDGSAITYSLAAGQRIIVSTGHLVLADATCSIDVQTVKGIKNIVFGGEGIFNTVITGPGNIVLQTMPTIKLAQAIQPYIVTSNS